MKRVALVGALLVALLVGGAQAAGELTLTVVSQTNSTITLGWTPQPGYGYLFSTKSSATAPWVLVSRTNDPARSSAKFSKTYSYEVAVIVKGQTGVYPSAVPPPPAPTATFTVSPNPATVGQNVTFDWTGSCATGGCTTTWEDEGPDGPGGTNYPLGTGDPLVRSFQAAGTKYVHLVVADTAGGIAESRQNLTVTDAAPPPPPPPPSGTCDLNATTATFVSQVSAASAGQTLCLASGDYGTWGGISKAITVRAADGASPQMKVSFGSGASGFTLSGMAGVSGSVNGSSNVTIRNSTFTGSLDISGSVTNLVLDSNTHNWAAVYSGGLNAKIYLGATGSRTLSSPAVTVSNSQIKNGDLDGIHIGSGSGYLILNNVFDNLCDRGTNHTDNLQFDTTVITQTRIAGNYVRGATCETQGITSYDHGTNGVIIENNVVDVPRPWGIELYADVNSVVRHNTVIYRPASNCFFNTTCGKINVTNKSGDPTSSGTQVYDNLAVADIGACNGCSVHHNTSSQQAVYVGPLTFHDGFLLSESSPVGNGVASDGTDAGIYPIG